jgi:hypothetical protein
MPDERPAPAAGVAAGAATGSTESFWARQIFAQAKISSIFEFDFPSPCVRAVTDVRIATDSDTI